MSIAGTGQGGGWGGFGTRPTGTAAIALLLVVSPLAWAAPKRGWLAPGVQFPSGLGGTAVRLRNACVSYYAFLSAGNFSGGLELLKARHGPALRGVGRPVTDFPPAIGAEFDLFVSRCSKDLRRVEPWRARIGSFVRSLQPEAGYGRNGRLRALPIRLVGEGRSPWLSPAWRAARFVVTTQGVHLSDPIVISLRAPGGEIGPVSLILDPKPNPRAVALVAALKLGPSQPTSKHWDPGVGPFPNVTDFLVTPTERVGDNCVQFAGYMRSGEFFGGLKRVQGPHGPTFRKGPRTVTYFPEVTHLVTEAAVGDRVDGCGWGLGFRTDAALCPGSLGGLRATAAYIDRLHRYPLQARVIESGIVLSPFDSVPVPGADWDFQSEAQFVWSWWNSGPRRLERIYLAAAGLANWTRWSYRLAVNTRGVPLADPLIVWLRNETGQTLGRFTLNLAGRTSLR